MIGKRYGEAAGDAIYIEHRATHGEFMRGREGLTQEPRLSMLRKIAGALGCSVKSLF